MAALGNASRLAAALALLLAACGPVDAPPPAAVPPPEPLALDAAGIAAADLRRGELLSLACLACHALDPARPSPLGPNLSGIFGRAAGSVAEFEYSPALADAAFVWTPEALDAWLADPRGYLPETTMAFAGFASPRDRRDLIAYLLTVTSPDRAEPGLTE